MRLPFFVFLSWLPKASFEIRREVFYFLNSCLTTSSNTERGNARSLRCETKQGQEEVKMSQKTCKECGREYEPDGGFGSYKSEGFCSEGCRARAHKRYQEEYLEKMQKKGKKKLAKWEKALEKDKKRIEKLKDALRSDDPKAIEKAIRGPLGRLWIILKCLFGLYVIVQIVTPIIINKLFQESGKPESTTVETSVEATSADLITEYQSVVNEVIKATPSIRKSEVEASYARAIETFKSSSIEEQKRHIEIVKKELETLKQTPSNNN